MEGLTFSFHNATFQKVTGPLSHYKQVHFIFVNS